MRYVSPCILKAAGSSCPSRGVPGADTCGDDRTETPEMAEDALAVALAGHMHEGLGDPGSESGRTGPGPGCRAAAGRGQARPVFGDGQGRCILPDDFGEPRDEGLARLPIRWRVELD